MNSRFLPALAILLVLNLGLTTYLLVTRDSAPSERKANPPSTKTEKSPQLDQLAGDIRALRSDLDLLRLDQAVDAEQPVTLNDRLAGMEKTIARLNDQMNGISIEGASAERAQLFTGENGHLKADEYFEAGKFAIAGEGYLAFLEAHPDHPDHRSILERARNAFIKANYKEKALWVQEGLIRIYPENKAGDLMTLANMERDLGRYDLAIKHAEESAEAHDTSQKYWSKLYAAWYTELDQGLEAGLDYHLRVQREIHDAGLGDTRLGIRVQEKIDGIQQQLNAPGRQPNKNPKNRRVTALNSE